MLGDKIVEANLVTGDDTFYFAETWMSQSNGNLMEPPSMPSPKRSSRDYSLPWSLNKAWLEAGRKFPGGVALRRAADSYDHHIFGSLDHSALVMSR